MALTFYSHISTDEVARQLSNDAKDTLETLTALAEIFEDEGDADDFAAEMARQHGGLPGGNCVAVSAGCPGQTWRDPWPRQHLLERSEMIPLPLDRDLTPEEQRGFSMACATIARFGALLARQPTVAGPASGVIRDMRQTGLTMAATAAAFDRQLGTGALRRPAPGALPGREAPRD